MLSIWFNVACVIYNILEKLNVASKTVLMNTDDLYSTLLVITPRLQFQNSFLPAIIPTIICFWFLLKNLKMGVILSGKHVKPTLSIKLRQLSLWASINVMTCIKLYIVYLLFFCYLLFLSSHTIPRHVINFRSLFYFIYISVNSWHLNNNFNKPNEDWYWPVEISQLNSISRCLISPCKSLLDGNVYYYC